MLWHRQRTTEALLGLRYRPFQANLTTAGERDEEMHNGTKMRRHTFTIGCSSLVTASASAEAAALSPRTAQLEAMIQKPRTSASTCAEWFKASQCLNCYLFARAKIKIINTEIRAFCRAPCSQDPVTRGNAVHVMCVSLRSTQLRGQHSGEAFPWARSAMNQKL